MSFVCVFLFLSTFCFRCWGYKNSCGARWAGSFCSPLCELATVLAAGPVLQQEALHQGPFGSFFWVLSCFGQMAVRFLCFLFLGLVAASFWFWVFAFLAPCDFPVFRFLCFFLGFPASGVFFPCLLSCILHLFLLG